MALTGGDANHVTQPHSHGDTGNPKTSLATQDVMNPGCQLHYQVVARLLIGGGTRDEIS